MPLETKQIAALLEVAMHRINQKDIKGAVTELIIATAYLCDHVKDLERYVEDEREMQRIRSGDQ